VQGDGAAAEIAAAIALLNEWSAREQAMAPERGIDIVLVTRGGGSLEDLWAFNEEPVARAVVASALPVVSAVGHEIDFTICDFAADLRAATPSAAAEIVTADIVACRPFLEDLPDRLRLQATRRLDRLRDEWRALSRHLQLLHPRRRLDDRAQRLDDLGDRRRRALAVQIERRRSRLEALAVRMRARRPEAVLVRRCEQWQSMRTRLVERARAHLERIRHRVDEAAARAELLSPAKVLGRGYSITREAGSGRLLRNANEVQPGAELVTRLAEGELRSRAL
jgi:exodeoxyribonuclease VII large subunit